MPKKSKIAPFDVAPPATPNSHSAQRTSTISIFPWWLYCSALVVACIALYIHTSSFSYTELDDSIFIRETEQYNRQDSAYLQSFKRGVFGDSSDSYYRPLLLNSYVFDRHREGKLTTLLHTLDNSSESISAYHWTNIVLHGMAVVLLFFLFRQLHCSNNQSFVATLIFAVHPVLTMAVSWIPGRNDSLLAVFLFSFLLSAFAFVQSKNWLLYALQFFFLLAALFTKETAIIAAPMALFLMIFLHKHEWKSIRVWLSAAAWGLALLCWLWVRSSATLDNQDLGTENFVRSFFEHSPLILQYLGKIILPFNLAVVPYQEQTSIVYGLIALILVAAAIWFTRVKDWHIFISGLVWFVVFLLPALVVPNSLNKEAYEHRLYLPMVGVLLLLIHTDVYKRFSEQKTLIATGLLAVVLFWSSYNRSDLFANKIVFWESAVQTAPQSAYCNMMLGARYYMDKVNPRRAEGEAQIRKAYGLDSTEKYVNYYMGMLLWDREKIAESEPYFRRELQKNPRWAELYFRLARCVIDRRDLKQGTEYLETHYQLNPQDSQGINNLIMVYLDQREFTKARDFTSRVRASGMEVPKDVQAKIDEGLKLTESTKSTVSTVKTPK